MQSENFDKKIKETLSQRPPGNDTPQWDKMETLLDKHLPVKEDDRRRIIFVVFLFLLLGGGAFLIWNNNKNNEKDITEAKPATENSTQKATTTSSRNTSPENTIAIKPGSNSTELSQSEAVKDASEQKPVQHTSKNHIKPPLNTSTNPLPGHEIEINASQKIARNNKPGNNDQAKTINSKKQKIVKKPVEVGKNKISDQVSINISSNTVTEPTKNDQQKTEDDLVKPVEDNSVNNKKEADNKIQDQQSKPQKSKPTLTANTKTQKQKGKNSFGNNLFFAVSAGTDFSAVGLGEMGKAQFVYGAGIGYQVTKKFAVRTGFYSARKVYTANPEDYNPPANFWAYYPNLKSIDANCKVYEIPVIIDYTISQNKKQSWFASAGLSSLLMKKETYEYYFKPASSPTYITYQRTISNQNKHYFSVLDLSGGYTRTINKSISLRAEPYAKFALSGIGYGKVKLNSGGILLSAIIKPFAKK